MFSLKYKFSVFYFDWEIKCSTNLNFYWIDLTHYSSYMCCSYKYLIFVIHQTRVQSTIMIYTLYKIHFIVMISTEESQKLFTIILCSSTYLLRKIIIGLRWTFFLCISPKQKYYVIKTYYEIKTYTYKHGLFKKQVSLSQSPN